MIMILMTSAFIGSVFASDEEDPNIKPIDIIVQQPIKEELEYVNPHSPIYLFFTNHTVNQTMVENSISLREVLTSKPVGNLTFNWATTGKGVAIGHDEFFPGTDYILELPKGQYGENGANTRDHFNLTFTTESIPPHICPIITLPVPSCYEEIEWTCYNTRSKPFRIIVHMFPEDENHTSTMILNFIIETNEKRNITLDFRDVEPGKYDLEIQVIDIQTGSLVDCQEKKIEILDRDEEEKERVDLLPILIAIFLMIIILIVFYLMYLDWKADKIKQD
jgi:hypothetical protein